MSVFQNYWGFTAKSKFDLEKFRRSRKASERKIQGFKNKKEKERREQVADGRRVSEYINSAFVPKDSKMASFYFFMSPIGKRRMFDMSYLLTNRLIVDFWQNRQDNFSSISSSICAILTEWPPNFIMPPQSRQIFNLKYILQLCRRIVCVFSCITFRISWVTRVSRLYSNIRRNYPKTSARQVNFLPS